MITCSQEINQINLLNESILPERSAPFEDKLKKLRNNLVIRKVDWREAYCVIEINRENATEESLKEFDTIDPYKELQIKFKGEVSYDAGGIIREWFTVLIKDLESQRRSKIAKILLRSIRNVRQ